MHSNFNWIILMAYAVVVCLAAPTGADESNVNPDRLPMFGQPRITRADNLKKSDEVFIRESILRYQTRQSASAAFAALGWKALRAKQLDAAMLTFNRSWLLNARNYVAFWGFGAVLSERGRLLEAIEQLETARELLDEPAQRSALLADLATLHSEYAASLPASEELERAQRFVIANHRFTECLENNSNFAGGWREWAISLYEQERYSEAWIRVKRARELRAEAFPPGFLNKLSEKMPEPK